MPAMERRHSNGADYRIPGPDRISCDTLEFTKDCDYVNCCMTFGFISYIHTKSRDKNVSLRLIIIAIIILLQIASDFFFAQRNTY